MTWPAILLGAIAGGLVGVVVVTIICVLAEMD